MIEVLHSFAMGITFALGVAIGAYLCAVASKIGGTQFRKDWQEHYRRTEERLCKTVEVQTRIADALEKLTKKDQDNERE